LQVNEKLESENFGERERERERRRKVKVKQSQRKGSNFREGREIKNLHCFTTCGQPEKFVPIGTLLRVDTRIALESKSLTGQVIKVVQYESGSWL